MQQDVLLVLDPDDLEEPHAERLLGDEAVARADIRSSRRAAGCAAPSGASSPRSGRQGPQPRPRVSRRFALLVNPAAAGGRALQRAAEVVAELDRLGAAHRTVETRSIEHARRGGRDGGRGRARRWRRSEVTAWSGRVAGALRHTEAALAIVPGGRGNDLARVLGIPDDPRRGRAAWPSRARSG